jgi:hypothetical protein
LGRANILHCFFAQSIGIAFTGLGKGNDLLSDGLLDIIGAIASPQSQASHLEGDAKDPPSLWVELLTNKKWGDGHGALQINRRERDWVSQPPTPGSVPIGDFSV